MDEKLRPGQIPATQILEFRIREYARIAYFGGGVGYDVWMRLYGKRYAACGDFDSRNAAETWAREIARRAGRQMRLVEAW